MFLFGYVPHEKDGQPLGNAATEALPYGEYDRWGGLFSVERS